MAVRRQASSLGLHTLSGVFPGPSTSEHTRGHARWACTALLLAFLPCLRFAARMACAWEAPVRQPCSWGGCKIHAGMSHESSNSMRTPQQTGQDWPYCPAACIMAEHVKQATKCLVLIAYHAGY